MVIRGDKDLAREIAEWLSRDLSPNSKPSMEPSYASFLNDTVRWDAANRSWVVSCKPRAGTIEIACDDRYLRTEITLRFG